MTLMDLALVISALVLFPLVIAVGLLVVAAAFWLLVTLVSNAIGPVVGIWALLLLACAILWESGLLSTSAHAVGRRWGAPWAERRGPRR